MNMARLAPRLRRTPSAISACTTGAIETLAGGSASHFASLCNESFTVQARHEHRRHAPSENLCEFAECGGIRPCLHHGRCKAPTCFKNRDVDSRLSLVAGRRMHRPISCCSVLSRSPVPVSRSRDCRWVSTTGWPGGGMHLWGPGDMPL